MEDHSIFMEKDTIPDNSDLETVLGQKLMLWREIRDYVFACYPQATEEWNFPGKKYGWSFRIKDKKRAIIYFLPRDGYFKVAFVFGGKAYNVILESNINEKIKRDLSEARVYAEGRGVRIDILDNSLFPDIKHLIKVKLEH